jgi:LCP family protein required for cell wall assembly
MDNNADNTEVVNITEEKVVQKKDLNDNIINIALFGLDRRQPYGYSRTDSIIIASIDQNNQEVKITSLMRDMYLPIPEKKSNRINAAYAIGGPLLAVKTINYNFGLDIREYVTIDFFGFEKVVDKLGGVEINVKEEEVKMCGVSGPGPQILNGEQALAYARIRYVGNADFERTERQRRVLNEVYKKIKEHGVLKLTGVVTLLLPYVETSLSDTEIFDLGAKAIKFNTNTLEQFRLPVDNTFKSQKIRGMAVLVPDIEENKKRLHEFIYGDN